MGVGYGWICVGGHNKGDCAFVDTRDSWPFSPEPVRPGNAEVDTLLPLDLDPHYRVLAERYLDHGVGEDQQAWRRPTIHTKEIGKEIINAITLHKLESERKTLHDEVVAVIS